MKYKIGAGVALLFTGYAFMYWMGVAAAMVPAPRGWLPYFIASTLTVLGVLGMFAGFLLDYEAKVRK